MSFVTDRARSHGKRYVTLRTTHLMTAAHRLYESLGFQRDTDHDMVFDDGFRLIAYRLTLDGTPEPGG